MYSTCHLSLVLLGIVALSVATALPAPDLESDAEAHFSQQLKEELLKKLSDQLSQQGNRIAELEHELAGLRPTTEGPRVPLTDAQGRQVFKQHLLAVGGYENPWDFEKIELNSRNGTVELYDPALNKWFKKSDMPNNRHSFAAAVLNNTVYLCGGQAKEHATTCDTYDVENDFWLENATSLMSVRRHSFGLAELDGKLYAVAGANYDGSTYYARRETRVERYDPWADKWTRCADLPTGIIDPRVVPLDGHLYVVSADMGVRQNKTFRYSPAEDRWTTLAPLLENSRWEHAAVAVHEQSGSAIYVVGGFTDAKNHASNSEMPLNNERYNVSANKWEEVVGTTLNQGRVNLQMAALSNGTTTDLYLVGGEVDYAGGYMATTTGVSWVEKITVPSSSSGVKPARMSPMWQSRTQFALLIVKLPAYQ